MSNTANVFPDGPIRCTGAIVLAGAESEEVFLCRCGRSARKPYCDGAHAGAFSDAGTVAPSGEAGGDGPVTLTPFPNGPVGIKGPLSVTDSGGNTAHVTKGALCRCGQSGNAPWCDGAHKGCGFTAP